MVLTEDDNAGLPRELAGVFWDRVVGPTIKYGPLFFELSAHAMQGRPPRRSSPPTWWSPGLRSSPMRWSPVAWTPVGRGHESSWATCASETPSPRLIGVRAAVGSISVVTIRSVVVPSARRLGQGSTFGSGDRRGKVADARNDPTCPLAVVEQLADELDRPEAQVISLGRETNRTFLVRSQHEMLLTDRAAPSA